MILRPGGSSNGSDVKAEESQNTICDKASEIMKQLRASTRRYEDLATRDLNITKPDWMLWMQDKKDLHDLNEASMHEAMRVIQGFLSPSPGMIPWSKPGGGDIVEQMAQEMFKGIRPEDQSETWGIIAQAQVKAFAGILRSMQDK